MYRLFQMRPTNDTFVNACTRGNIATIDRLIYQNMLTHADLNIGAGWATECNQTFTIAFLVGKGADNWQYFMEQACEKSTLATLKYIFRLAPPFQEWDWNQLLYHAIKGNRLSHLEHIIYRGGKWRNWNWNMALYQSYMMDHHNMATKIITIAGSNYHWDLNTLLLAACLTGKESTVRDVLELVKPGCRLKYLYPLQALCLRGNLDIFSWLVKRCVENLNWNLLLQSACFSGNYELVAEIIRLGGAAYDWDWYSAFKDALSSGNDDIVKLIINMQQH
jgi:hypothetical protein